MFYILNTNVSNQHHNKRMINIQQMSRRDFLRIVGDISMIAVLAGCSYNEPTYRVSPDVQRPAVVDSFEGWRRLYNSIDGRVLSPEEARYVEWFNSLSKEEKFQLLNDPLLEKTNFLERKNPTIRDIAFLYYVDSHVRENYLHLKK